MNNLLFAVLIIALLYYFYYRSKSISSPPNSKPLTQSISTQTNLSDKQISLLTQQWNQVAQWAQELGIDTNRSWNLSLLKNKIKQELETVKKPPLKVQYSRTTQTDNHDSESENILDNLISSLQQFNQALDNPQLTELQTALQLANNKLQGKAEWESWETKEGLEKHIEELEEKIKQLKK
jgi:hypothetical protein